MNPVLEDILRTGEVTSDEGERFSLGTGGPISREEGELLQRVIGVLKPKISLEIGLAYGISTLFICEALKKVGANKHIVIDQDQSTLFKGIGLKNLGQAGYGELIEFIEEPSEIALPELLTRKTRVDFAFIDGWHTFDHTLLDFFYVNMMLNVGGIVAFDDTTLSSISELCRFISRYPCYRIFSYLPSDQIRKPVVFARILRRSIVYPNSIKYIKEDLRIASAGRCIAFMKVSEDKRDWTWHEQF